MRPSKLGAKSQLNAAPLVRIAELEIDPAQLRAYLHYSRSTEALRLLVPGIRALPWLAAAPTVSAGQRLHRGENRAKHGATTMNQQLQFGYYPDRLDLTSGTVTIASLPDREATKAAIERNEGVVDGWIYAPPQLVHDFSGRTIQRPYASRVFGLPKTHVFEHASSEGDDHLAFHLWCLSFFTGMRLTGTEAGFVDATPIKPGTLADFVLLGRGLDHALQLAEAFWHTHRSAPGRARLMGGTIHALLLAKDPQRLQFERFTFLYAAIDACFALCKSVAPPAQKISHGRRVEWLCSRFNMPLPHWADPSGSGGAEVASIRNGTVHEALFMGQPLGFALHGVGIDQNITLEMEGLISRLVVALLGEAQNEYVVSPVTTRQMHELRLG